MSRSYNCYGSHTTLSPVGDFLLLGADDFGDAVKEITVTLHFLTSGPPKKTLDQLFEAHHLNRLTLPKIVCRRAKGQVAIDIASDLIDGDDWEPSPRLSLPLFERAVGEVVQALSLMRKRLKSSDSFNLEAFLAHCDAGLQRIPATEDDLQILAAELKAADQAKRDAMSPWEKLGVDWDDCHPRAREILDEPFFWNCTDDFSPNGNDTGADLLENYRDWLMRHKGGKPDVFFEQLAKQWGYVGLDQMDEVVRDEAAIGLAFAEIKLKASCDEKVREWAIESIVRQRNQAEVALGWSNRIERLQSLDKIERKLQQLKHPSGASTE